MSQEQDADRAATRGDFAAAAALLQQAAAADPENPNLWTKLSAMRKATGALPAAIEAIDRALALRPLDFAGLLYRAVLLEGLGDARSGEAFGHALAQAPDEIPPPMLSAVAHARKRWAAHQEASEARLRAVLPRDLGDAERNRAERLIANFAHRTRHFHQEPTHVHFPGLPEIEFHDPAAFPGLAALEEATDAIRAEFDALIAAEAAEMVPYIQYPDHVPLAQWRELNRNKAWTAIHLLKNGERIETNARHCPQTLEAIARLPMPDVRGASPNAMFSLLAPRTRIPPHTGVANTRLVCHLPLIVPPDCGFRCGATTREWRTGEAFVFDDTIEHEAWNDSDELRVVLIVDLWPPALGPGDRRAVAAVIGNSGAGLMGGA